MRKHLLLTSLLSSLVLVACGDDGGGDDGNNNTPDAGLPADAGNETPDAGDDTPDAAVEGIGAVTDFTASADGAGAIDLAWTNPGNATLTGILIVVGEDVDIDFTPEDGTAYNVDDSVGTAAGQTVLSNELGTTAQLAEAVAGLDYNFAAFAYDDTLAYSEVTLASERSNALGTQTATLSVDLTNEQVTVNAPAHLGLAATATYDNPNDALSIELTVTNNTNRLLFNLKSLSTAINQGTQAGNLFPLTGGQPMVYFGPEAQDVGASVIRTIDLSGIDDSVSPITVDLEFVDAPMFVGGNFGGDFVGVDTSGSHEGFAVQFAGNGENMRQMVMSPDGSTIIGVAKNENAVAIVDMTTLTVVGGTDLSTNGLGSGGGIAQSASGADIYVGYNDGAHYHGSDGNSGGQGSVTAPTVDIIKFDSALTEQARLNLPIANQDGHTVKSMYISPDQSTLAALVSTSAATPASELWLVDLATFALIDTDAGTAGDQPVTLSGVGFAEHGAWSTDGSTFFVGFNDHKNGNGQPQVDVVDIATFGVTQLTANAPGIMTGAMAFANGKLYYTTRDDGAGVASGLNIFDIAGDSQVTADLGASTVATGIAFGPDGSEFYVADFATIHFFDAATDTRIDTDGDAGNDITPVTAGEQMRAHIFAMSPF